MIIPDYIKNPLHPITVNVIGVGGTGSLVLPRLARMDYGLKLLGHPGLMVFAYDDDIVEPFNVGRQNFTKTDIGKNKAICIVEKCNLSYGLLWEACAEKYNVGLSSSCNINIICVDSAKFRYDFYKGGLSGYYTEINNHRKHFFDIDGGNGKDFGQVIISTREKRTKLKNPIQLFPNIMKEETEKEQGIRGCSYEDSLEKQDFFINDEIAIGIMKLMWKLFRDKEININAIVINQEKCKQLPILV